MQSFYCGDKRFIWPPVAFRVLDPIKKSIDGLRRRHYANHHRMKLAGFLLLLAGWGIILAAVVLLPSALSRTGFVLAGIGVEVLGLILVFRSHRVLRGERG